MTIEEVFRAICDNPEDDDLRLQYAELIQSSDLDHAADIRQELINAHLRRHGLPREGNDVTLAVRLRQQEQRAPNLVRFLPRVRSEGRIEVDGLMFDRGFPVAISIHPLVFLEYADLLFRLAPIRHVRFREPYDQEDLLPGPCPRRPDGSVEPFPIDALLAMPQLARLDSFGFEFSRVGWREIMPDDAWEKIAACPYLTRCQVLDIGLGGLIVDSSFAALAAGPLTGKMIRIYPYSTVDGVGEQRRDELDLEHGPQTRTTFSELGKELERKHGYIPWLHTSHYRNVGWMDVAYHVLHGKLPKFPAGTPPMPEWYEFPIEVHPRTLWNSW